MGDTAANRYFHVVAWVKGDAESPVFLFGDLLESDLEKKFLRYYRAGRKLLADRHLYDIHDLVSVSIIETEVPKDRAIDDFLRRDRDAIDRLNQSSHVFFLGRISGPNDVDVLEVGEDVTSRYIKGPPGEGRTLVDIINHPWTLTVLGGLIVALIAAAVM